MSDTGPQQFQVMINNVLTGDDFIDFSEFERLEQGERGACLAQFIETARSNAGARPKLLRYVTSAIPYLAAEYRFPLLMKVILLLQKNQDELGKDVYNLIDFGVVKSLQDLESMVLANHFAAQLKDQFGDKKRVAMWGLVRLIPYLNPVSRKEHVHEIFSMHAVPDLQGDVLEALTALVYSLDQSGRSDVTAFFLDTLKAQNHPMDKFFVLDVLQRITPALPEGNRLIVVDHVAPLIYYTDTFLVKKCIAFFSEVIALLPVVDRFHYTQVVAGLINDLSVRADVLATIEKALPYLASSSERQQIKELISHFSDQFSDESGDDFIIDELVLTAMH